MKRTNQMQKGSPSLALSSSSFQLRQSLGVQRASFAKPTSSGWQQRAWASSDKRSWNSANRSDGVLEYRSFGKQTCVFCGLSLELLARAGISTKTVLPKAAKTAGIMMARLNLGVASADSPRRAVTISMERRVVSKQ
jgi:hypothetical protein